MLPPPGIALAAALCIGVARAVVVGHAHVGGAELAGVAGVLVVPGAAAAAGLAVRTGQVAVLEVERAACHRLVVGGAVVALVDARGGNQVRLIVAVQADPGRAVAAVVLGGLALFFAGASLAGLILVCHRRLP